MTLSVAVAAVEPSGPARHRPSRLADVAGHARVRANLSILVEAARRRGGVPPHMLFSGPPGLGKTTLALAVAAELAAPVVQCQGDSLGVAALRDILKGRVRAGTVLVIDEIHRMQGPAVELLYRPLEDGLLILDGEEVALPPFTCIGATTATGRIAEPLRQRFRERFGLEFLDAEDLAAVAWSAAATYGIILSRQACVEVARRSKGTPRRAVRLVGWIADCAAARGADVAEEVSPREVDDALLRISVGREGFDALDRRYLDALAMRFHGGPVGVRALASVLGEDVDTVEGEVEPWLVRNAYVLRTARGRAMGPGPGGAS